jgi:hypothetical protein
MKMGRRAVRNEVPILRLIPRVISQLTRNYLGKKKQAQVSSGA